LTGITKNHIANLDPASLTSSVAASTSTMSKAASTIIVTATHGPTTTAGSSSAKPNTIGIAVGVVVGLIALAAIIGGVVFFLRNRRRREVEEEYKRQAAVNSFVNGVKTHQSQTSTNDSRLEPHILQRRESTGSIADNQDYSRRILKVSLLLLDKLVVVSLTDRKQVRNPDDFN
jgi:cell wall integrity and stress response component